LKVDNLKGKIRWQGDVVFQAESGSGHSITIDGPPDMGGQNKGVRPMELLLLGTAGCSTFDVLTMLKKGRQDITDCVCEVEAERADAVPAVFTKIHLHFLVTGHGLKESQVKRAVQLSAEKYCSASIMLDAAGVDITHDYEIIEA
jgi:putative redox protein